MQSCSGGRSNRLTKGVETLIPGVIITGLTLAVTPTAVQLANRPWSHPLLSGVLSQPERRGLGNRRQTIPKTIQPPDLPMIFNRLKGCARNLQPSAPLGVLNGSTSASPVPNGCVLWVQISG